MAPEKRPAADLITTIDSGTGSDTPAGTGQNIVAFAQGRYVVQRLLGEGGQKQVFLTHDEHLARDVVVAVLKMRLLDDGAVARLRSEARALARLGDHPHIVAVHDIGDEDGAPYIVAQYVDGGTLAQLIAERGTLEILEALRICREVAQALAYAHDSAIVHRDVKPGNIWLTRSGAAKLGDFGLAASLTQLSRVSGEHTLLGTVAYMAPEQALGRAVDERADLYSLGIVLYELVAGRRPFLGDTIAAVLSQHLNEPPVAPSWHNPAVPPSLDAFILKLLAKSPDDRPQTARDVADALDGVAADARAGLLTEPSKQTRPLGRLAAGVFVGRVAELAQLRHALEQARGGAGSIVQVVGEAGAGKTALTEQFATHARLTGAHVSRAQCYEGENAPAYWPWIQALRGSVHGRSPEQLLALMGEGAAAVAALDSQIGRLLPTITTAVATEPDDSRFRLFDGVTTFFRNISRVEPLVIIIDDLHWMDAASLRLLQFIARDLAHQRILILITMRPVTAGHHPISQTLSLIARQGLEGRIVLDGLSEEDVRRFLEITIAGTAPASLVAPLHQRTEGNPFFIKEIVRLLVAEGQLRSEQPVQNWNLRLPETVREVLTLRLTQLSEPCNRLLAMASVCGREFDLEIVRQIADLPEDALLGALEEAIAARVVVEAASEPGSCRFAHTLIRYTVYESMSASRRARVHLRIAKVLEHAPAERRDLVLPALAHHFGQSIPLGQADKALEYGQLAAESAARRLAYEEAATHYQLALRALDWTTGVEPLHRARMLLSLGDVQVKAGSSVDARESFREAAELGRQAQSPVTVASAVLALTTATAAGTRLGHDVDPVEIRYLRDALAALPVEEESLRARLLAQLALSSYHQTADRLSFSEEALAISRRVAEPAAVIGALYSRCVGLEGFPKADERYAFAAELVAIAERVGDIENALRGRFRCFRELMELSDVDAAEREVDAYAQLAESTRQPRYRWYVPYCRAVLMVFRGHFARAEALLDEALALGTRAQDPNAPLLCDVIRYSILIHRGAAAEAALALRMLIDTYPPSSRAHRIQLTRLYCRTGRLEAAAGMFGELARNDFADLPVDGTFVSSLAALGNICWHLRDARRARIIYDRLLPYASYSLVAGNSVSSGGALALPLAVCAAALSEWDDAERFFHEAIARNTRMRARPWLVHTYAAWVQMLTTRRLVGDTERAAGLLQTAKVLGAELGMTWINTLAAGSIQHA